jgi:RNA polymerase sigma-70 factor (ECF subfamily)
VAGERKAPVSEVMQRELLVTFLEAARSGDLAELEKLFAADVASIADGNGARQISRKVVAGAARVAKYIAAFSTWYWEGVEVRYITTNGQPSAVMTKDGKLLGAVTLSVSADGIEQVLWMMNPDKLHHWQPR